MTTGESTAHRALARVNVAAIERNCARLRGDLHDGAELCAVVKADGYGHGAVQSARAAIAGGASWLAVAAASEARELREAGLRDADLHDASPHGPNQRGLHDVNLRNARILVMGALTEGELDAGARRGCRRGRVERAPGAGCPLGGRRQGAREARFRHGAPRHARSGAGFPHGGRGARRRRGRAGGADDALRHRRRSQRRRVLRDAARPVHGVGDGA